MPGHKGYVFWQTVIQVKSMNTMFPVLEFYQKLTYCYEYNNYIVKVVMFKVIENTLDRLYKQTFKVDPYQTCLNTPWIGRAFLCSYFFSQRRLKKWTNTMNIILDSSNLSKEKKRKENKHTHMSKLHRSFTYI